jgi:hypothetical protein
VVLRRGLGEVASVMLFNPEGKTSARKKREIKFYGLLSVTKLA